MNLRFPLFFHKAIVFLVIVAFLFTAIIPPSIYAQMQPLVASNNLMGLTPVVNPPLLKGIVVDPQKPFHFDFILDKGDFSDHRPQTTDSRPLDEELKKESEKLIKYFLTALTIPEDELWVNLSPYEKDRIVPEKFGQTEMGRDLLAQDYILKQLTASLMYPENALGKKFWEKIYKTALQRYGTTDIPVDAFNKVWIVPEKATVYENGNRAYVVEARLKVMLEEDYLSSQKSVASSQKKEVADQRNNLTAERRPLATEIIREIILPALEREVNTGEHFAKLRQIYNSLILATWYKKNLQKSLLNRKYSDQKKTNGVQVADKQEKYKIYERYVESFKQGVYNYIKEEYDPAKKEIVPRKYFSGGAGLNQIKDVFQETTDPAMLNFNQDDLLEIKGGYQDAAMVSSLKLGIIPKSITENVLRFYENNGINSTRFIDNHTKSYDPFDSQAVTQLFTKDLELDSGEKFVDLGSGDGRVVLLAGLLSAHAVGIEFDRKLFEKSVELIDQFLEEFGNRKDPFLKKNVLSKNRITWKGVNGFPGSVTLINGNYLRKNFSLKEYGVVYRYFPIEGLSSINERNLQKKISSEMQPGAIFVEAGVRKSMPKLDMNFSQQKEEENYYRIYQKDAVLRQAQDKAMGADYEGFQEIKEKVFAGLQNYPLATFVTLKDGSSLIIVPVQERKDGKKFLKVQYQGKVFVVDLLQGIVMDSDIQKTSKIRAKISVHRIDPVLNELFLNVNKEIIEIDLKNPLKAEGFLNRQILYVYPDFDPMSSDFQLKLKLGNLRPAKETIARGKFSLNKDGPTLILSNVDFLSQSLSGNVYSLKGMGFLTQIFKRLREASQGKLLFNGIKVGNRPLRAQIKKAWENLNKDNEWKVILKSIPVGKQDFGIVIPLSQLKQKCNPAQYQAFKDLMNQILRDSPVGKNYVNAGYSVEFDFGAMTTFGDGKMALKAYSDHAMLSVEEWMGNPWVKNLLIDRFPHKMEELEEFLIIDHPIKMSEFKKVDAWTKEAVIDHLNKKIQTSVEGRGMGFEDFNVRSSYFLPSMGAGPDISQVFRGASGISAGERIERSQKYLSKYQVRGWVRNTYANLKAYYYLLFDQSQPMFRKEDFNEGGDFLTAFLFKNVLHEMGDSGFLKNTDSYAERLLSFTNPLIEELIERDPRQKTTEITSEILVEAMQRKDKKIARESIENYLALLKILKEKSPEWKEALAPNLELSEYVDVKKFKKYHDQLKLLEKAVEGLKTNDQRRTTDQDSAMLSKADIKRVPDLEVIQKMKALSALKLENVLLVFLEDFKGNYSSYRMFDNRIFGLHAYDSPFKDIRKETRGYSSSRDGEVKSFFKGLDSHYQMLSLQFRNVVFRKDSIVSQLQSEEAHKMKAFLREVRKHAPHLPLVLYLSGEITSEVRAFFGEEVHYFSDAFSTEGFSKEKFLQGILKDYQKRQIQKQLTKAQQQVYQFMAKNRDPIMRELFLAGLLLEDQEGSQKDLEQRFEKHIRLRAENYKYLNNTIFNLFKSIYSEDFEKLKGILDTFLKSNQKRIDPFKLEKLNIRSNKILAEYFLGKPFVKAFFPYVNFDSFALQDILEVSSLGYENGYLILPGKLGRPEVPILDPKEYAKQVSLLKKMKIMMPANVYRNFLSQMGFKKIINLNSFDTQQNVSLGADNVDYDVRLLEDVQIGQIDGKKKYVVSFLNKSKKVVSEKGGEKKDEYASYRKIFDLLTKAETLNDQMLKDMNHLKKIQKVEKSAVGDLLKNLQMFIRSFEDILRLVYVREGSNIFKRKEQKGEVEQIVSRYYEDLQALRNIVDGIDAEKNPREWRNFVKKTLLYDHDDLRVHTVVHHVHQDILKYTVLSWLSLSSTRDYNSAFTVHVVDAKGNIAPLEGSTIQYNENNIVPEKPSQTNNAFSVKFINLSEKENLSEGTRDFLLQIFKQLLGRNFIPSENYKAVILDNSLCLYSGVGAGIGAHTPLLFVTLGDPAKKGKVSVRWQDTLDDESGGELRNEIIYQALKKMGFDAEIDPDQRVALGIFDRNSGATSREDIEAKTLLAASLFTIMTNADTYLERNKLYIKDLNPENIADNILEGANSPIFELLGKGKPQQDLDKVRELLQKINAELLRLGLKEVDATPYVSGQKYFGQWVLNEKFNWPIKHLIDRGILKIYPDASLGRVEGYREPETTFAVTSGKVFGKIRKFVPGKTSSYYKDRIIVAKRISLEDIHVIREAKGLLTEKGNKTGHVAFNIGEMGIPWVVSADLDVDKISDNELCLVDPEKALIRFGEDSREDQDNQINQEFLKDAIKNIPKLKSVEGLFVIFRSLKTKEINAGDLPLNLSRDFIKAYSLIEKRIQDLQNESLKILEATMQRINSSTEPFVLDDAIDSLIRLQKIVARRWGSARPTDYNLLKETIEQITKKIEHRTYQDKDILSVTEAGKISSKHVGNKASRIAETLNMLLDSPYVLNHDYPFFGKLFFPRGFLITNEVFQKHIERVSGQSLEQLLSPTATTTPEQMKKYLSEEFSPKVKTEIMAAYHDLLGDRRVSVRPSSIIEGAEYSLSGMLESYLNVNEGFLLDAIKKAMGSLMKEKALNYIERNNIDLINELRQGVIVEEMVDADVSGVLRTVDPNAIEQNHMLVEAVYGLGPGVVEDKVGLDRIEINKENNAIVSYSVGEKDEMFVADQDHPEKYKKIPVAYKRAIEPALNQDQVELLADVAKYIEDYYGYPVVIEFSFQDGLLTILQVDTLRSVLLKKSEKNFVNNLMSNVISSRKNLEEKLTDEDRAMLSSQKVQEIIEGKWLQTHLGFVSNEYRAILEKGIKAFLSEPHPQKQAVLDIMEDWDFATKKREFEVWLNSSGPNGFKDSSNAVLFPEGEDLTFEELIRHPTAGFIDIVAVLKKILTYAESETIQNSLDDHAYAKKYNVEEYNNFEAQMESKLKAGFLFFDLLEHYAREQSNISLDLDHPEKQAELWEYLDKIAETRGNNPQIMKNVARNIQSVIGEEKSDQDIEAVLDSVRDKLGITIALPVEGPETDRESQVTSDKSQEKNNKTAVLAEAKKEKFLTLDEAYKFAIKRSGKWFGAQEKSKQMTEILLKLKDPQVEKVMVVGDSLRWLAQILSFMGKDVTYVDRSYSYAKVLGLEMKIFGEEKGLDFKFDVQSKDLKDVNLTPNSFDAILCVDLIVDVDPFFIKKNLLKVEELLKPEGYLVIDSKFAQPTLVPEILAEKFARVDILKEHLLGVYGGGDVMGQNFNTLYKLTKFEKDLAPIAPGANEATHKKRDEDSAMISLKPFSDKQLEDARENWDFLMASLGFLQNSARDIQRKIDLEVEGKSLQGFFDHLELWLDSTEGVLEKNLQNKGRNRGYYFKDLQFKDLLGLINSIDFHSNKLLREIRGSLMPLGRSFVFTGFDKNNNLVDSQKAKEAVFYDVEDTLVKMITQIMAIQQHIKLASSILEGPGKEDPFVLEAKARRIRADAFYLLARFEGYKKLLRNILNPTAFRPEEVMTHVEGQGFAEKTYEQFLIPLQRISKQLGLPLPQNFPFRKDQAMGAVQGERKKVKGKSKSQVVQEFFAQHRPAGIYLANEKEKIRKEWPKYIKREKLSKYKHLVKLFDEDTDEMWRIKAALLTNPHWRPVFMQVLPQREEEKIIPLKDFHKIEALGSFELLQKHKCFSVGFSDERLDRANDRAKQYFQQKNVLSQKALIEEGLKIIVALTDRESLDEETMMSGLNVAHGRRVFSPLSDGSYLMPKGVGQFRISEYPPYYSVGFGFDKWVGLVRDKETEDYIKEEFDETGSRYVDSLGYQYIYELPDFKGKMNKIYDYREGTMSLERAVILYDRTLFPDRLMKLPQILRYDPGLKKMCWTLSRALEKEGLLEQGRLLKPNELMDMILRQIARNAVFLFNQNWFKSSHHSQDVGFDGADSDKTERHPVSYFLGKEFTLQTKRFETLKDNVQIFAELVRFSGKYRKELFPSIEGSFALLVKTYFQSLNKEGLDFWLDLFSGEQASLIYEILSPFVYENIYAYLESWGQEEVEQKIRQWAKDPAMSSVLDRWDEVEANLAVLQKEAKRVQAVLEKHRLQPAMGQIKAWWEDREADAKRLAENSQTNKSIDLVRFMRHFAELIEQFNQQYEQFAQEVDLSFSEYKGSSQDFVFFHSDKKTAPIYDVVFFALGDRIQKVGSEMGLLGHFLTTEKGIKGFLKMDQNFLETISRFDSYVQLLKDIQAPMEIDPNYLNHPYLNIPDSFAKFYENFLIPYQQIEQSYILPLQKDFKVILTDLDDSILDGKNPVLSEEGSGLIEYHRAQERMIIPSTAKDREKTLENFYYRLSRKARANEYMETENGARISKFDAVGNTVGEVKSYPIFEDEKDADHLEKVLREAADEVKSEYPEEFRKDIFQRVKNDAGETLIMKFYDKQMNENVRKKLAEKIREKIARDEKLKRIEEIRKLAQGEEYEDIKVLESSVAVNVSRVDKGKAARYLMEKLKAEKGLKEEDVLVLGDSEVDDSMYRALPNATRVYLGNEPYPGMPKNLIRFPVKGYKGGELVLRIVNDVINKDRGSEKDGSRITTPESRKEDQAMKAVREFGQRIADRVFPQGKNEFTNSDSSEDLFDKIVSYYHQYGDNEYYPIDEDKYGNVYGPSNEEMVKDLIFTDAVLSPGQKFIDLGSGDGRIVVLAALFGAEATGFEAHKPLFLKSVELVDKLLKKIKKGNPDFDFEKKSIKNGYVWDLVGEEYGAIRIVMDDYLNDSIDFGEYEVVYKYFAHPGLMYDKELKKKVISQCKEGSTFVEVGVAEFIEELPKPFNLKSKGPGRNDFESYRVYEIDSAMGAVKREQRKMQERQAHEIKKFAVQEIASLLRSIREKILGDASLYSKKEDGTLLTIADTLSQMMTVMKLQELFPADGFIGEEVIDAIEIEKVKKSLKQYEDLEGIVSPYVNKYEDLLTSGALKNKVDREGYPSSIWVLDPLDGTSTFAGKKEGKNYAWALYRLTWDPESKKYFPEYSFILFPDGEMQYQGKTMHRPAVEMSSQENRVEFFVEDERGELQPQFSLRPFVKGQGQQEELPFSLGRNTASENFYFKSAQKIFPLQKIDQKTEPSISRIVEMMLGRFSAHNNPGMALWDLAPILGLMLLGGEIIRGDTGEKFDGFSKEDIDRARQKGKVNMIATNGGETTKRIVAVVQDVNDQAVAGERGKVRRKTLDEGRSIADRGPGIGDPASPAGRHGLEIGESRKEDQAMVSPMVAMLATGSDEILEMKQSKNKVLVKTERGYFLLKSLRRKQDGSWVNIIENSVGNQWVILSESGGFVSGPNSGVEPEPETEEVVKDFLESNNAGAQHGKDSGSIYFKSKDQAMINNDQQVVNKLLNSSIFKMLKFGDKQQSVYRQIRLYAHPYLDFYIKELIDNEIKEGPKKGVYLKEYALKGWKIAKERAGGLIMPFVIGKVYKGNYSNETLTEGLEIVDVILQKKSKVFTLQETITNLAKQNKVDEIKKVIRDFFRLDQELMKRGIYMCDPTLDNAIFDDQGNLVFIDAGMFEINPDYSDFELRGKSHYFNNRFLNSLIGYGLSKEDIHEIMLTYGEASGVYISEFDDQYFSFFEDGIKNERYSARGEQDYERFFNDNAIEASWEEVTYNPFADIRVISKEERDSQITEGSVFLPYDSAMTSKDSARDESEIRPMAPALPEGRRGSEADQAMGEDVQSKEYGVRSKERKGILPTVYSVLPTKKGGIDLNPNLIDMETQGNGAQLSWPDDPGELELIEINGLVPVIFSITPVTNLPLLLGLDTKEQLPDAQIAAKSLEPFDKNEIEHSELPL